MIPPGYSEIAWTRGFAAAIGPLYEKVEHGRCARAFRVEDRHTNGQMNAHGGMLMSFADMAFGHAVSFERSAWWVTVRLVCDFLDGAQAGDWVEGAGEIIAEDGPLYIVQGRVWVGERTILTGTGVFKTVRPRPPRPGEKAFTADGQD